MLLKLWQTCAFRNFSNTSLWRNIEKIKSPETIQPKTTAPAQGTASSQDSTNLNIGIIPKIWEKRMLVWMGKYKSLEEVPRRISYDTLNHLKSKARIRVANWMMFIAFLACLGFSFKGKMDAKHGDSLAKRLIKKDEDMLKKHRAE